MRTTILAAVSISALSWSCLAAAQTAEDVYADRDNSSAVIIVTGEKAARSLQDTVTSVAVVTPQKIEQEHIVSLQEVFQRTANVTETYGTTGFTIRGIANYGVSGGGDGALATVYVDGAAMPATLLQTAPTDMWDVAQVEILRGPQSTLQGLNALAGAIIVQTAEPGDVWEVRARASYTDADESQLAIAAGGPLVPGELGIRVSAEKRDADGFTWNPTRNTHENPLDSMNLRGKLVWTPSSLNGFEARLGYTHYQRKGGYRFSYTDAVAPDFFENRINKSDYPNDSDANTNLATLDLRLDLGGGFKLNGVSAYSHITESNRYDNDGTEVPGSEFDQNNDYKTFSQEIRLNYESDRLSALFGGFYYHRDHASSSTSDVGVTTPVDTISGLLQSNGLDAGTAGFLANLYAQALPEIPVNYASQSAGTVETFAVFGDARFKLTDHLTLLAGLRYDHEKNQISTVQATSFAGVYPDPLNYGAPGSDFYNAIYGINLGVAALVADASGAAVSLDRTFEAFLPKGGIEMAWTDDIKTAVTVQRGYRSGGSSVNIARSQTFAYDPEYTWNYEFSFRSAWLDNALTLNANAFYIDWTNQQVNVNFGNGIFDTHTINAGKSHIYGFEVEAAHRVSRNFDWYAAVGHTRTKFDEFNVDLGTVSDLSGLEFAYAPHWTLSGGINATFADRVRVNLNANYRSQVFSEANKPQVDKIIADRVLVNGRVSFDTDHFSISAFASNIFNEQYIQYGTADYPQAVLGNPRVLGLAIETKW